VASDAEHKTACKATNFANNESQKQMLLMLQASAALQTFCNSLIHSDVSTLLLEVCEWDAHSFTQWSMYQRAAESLLDLLAMPAVCALADAYGRRPLLLLTGPFELCGWSLLGALVPRTLTAKPLIAFMKAFSSVTNTAFLTVSSSAQFDLLQNQPKELADALAAGQSYVGLAVVGAPLLSILLRRRMGAHAPFWVAGVLSSLVLGAMLTVPETLQTSGRRAIELRKLNPLGSATLLFRQGSNLARLAMMYSIQSVTRCVDAYLHTFMELRLGWGHTQMSKLLSFWGFCVFVGSSLLRKALKHFSARSIVLAGTLFSAADLFFSRADASLVAPASGARLRASGNFCRVCHESNANKCRKRPVWGGPGDCGDPGSAEDAANAIMCSDRLTTHRPSIRLVAASAESQQRLCRNTLRDGKPLQSSGACLAPILCACISFVGNIL